MNDKNEPQSPRGKLPELLKISWMKQRAEHNNL
jgi:hypothetical protein